MPGGLGPRARPLQCLRCLARAPTKLRSIVVLNGTGGSLSEIETQAARLVKLVVANGVERRWVTPVRIEIVGDVGDILMLFYRLV